MAIDLMSIRRELLREHDVEVPYFHSDYICFKNMLDTEEELKEWVLLEDMPEDTLTQLEDEIDHLLRAEKCVIKK